MPFLLFNLSVTAKYTLLEQTFSSFLLFTSSPLSPLQPILPNPRPDFILHQTIMHYTAPEIILTSPFQAFATIQNLWDAQSILWQRNRLNPSLVCLMKPAVGYIHVGTFCLGPKIYLPRSIIISRTGNCFLASLAPKDALVPYHLSSRFSSFRSTSAPICYNALRFPSSSAPSNRDPSVDIKSKYWGAHL